MLTQEEDVEIHALRRRGWSISAIARHTGRDRKTIRAYLVGERQVGVRAETEADPFDRIESYVAQRLSDDHGVWATVLFDEVKVLGYDRSYPTFTRKLRERRLRPHCEACAASNGRAHVDIEHLPGVEIQWDWLELAETPWGDKAFVLVGVLSHSAKFRAWITDSDDQPHLVEGVDAVLRRLGGTARRWRVDRMATVINPTTGKIQTSFVPVAKHYGVGVDPCPPRHPNRKGVVEAAIHYLTQRWWRTAAVNTLAEAQASLDRFCATISDVRRRGESTVRDLADAEPLLELPAVAYPAEGTMTRTVAANALVSVWGNRYSVPPAVVGQEVTVRWRLGTGSIDVVSASGVSLATHQTAPRSSGRIVRLPQHARALQDVVLAAFTTDRPHKTKVNRPPSEPALRVAAQLTGSGNAGSDPVIDLATYQRFIDGKDGV